MLAIASFSRGLLLTINVSCHSLFLAAMDSRSSSSFSIRAIKSINSDAAARNLSGSGSIIARVAKSYRRYQQLECWFLLPYKITHTVDALEAYVDCRHLSDVVVHLGDDLYVQRVHFGQGVFESQFLEVGQGLEGTRSRPRMLTWEFDDIAGSEGERYW